VTTARCRRHHQIKPLDGCAGPGADFNDDARDEAWNAWLKTASDLARARATVRRDAAISDQRLPEQPLDYAAGLRMLASGWTAHQLLSRCCGASRHRTVTHRAT
jgi:hypothetical protein